MKKLILNNRGHGHMVPSGKELLAIAGIILTAPISFPIIYILDKRKKCKRCRHFNGDNYCTYLRGNTSCDEKCTSFEKRK